MFFLKFAANMIQIFIKEVSLFFSSLTAYIVMGIFLLVTGLFVWVFPQSSVLESGFAQLDTLFSMSPYIFMFLIPAVTMRSFADEKKSGTLEILFTRPLSDWQIIMGKYLSCWFLVLIALLPTLLYVYAVSELGSPKGNLDMAAVLGSYIGLICLAGVFVSMGIFASSLTDNQIVAFLIAVFMCFLGYDGLSLIASVNVWASYSYPIAQLGIDQHYASISRGLIDSRDLMYFASFVTAMLALTGLVLGSRKW
jgi:ABC-2 type transport system permease protein